jgi:hypothetical protein
MTFKGPVNLSRCRAAMLTAVSGVVQGVGGTPVRWAKRIKRTKPANERERELLQDADSSSDINGQNKHMPNGNAKHGIVNGNNTVNEHSHGHRHNSDGSDSGLLAPGAQRMTSRKNCCRCRYWTRQNR